jgi:hypothetical protein
VVSEGEMEKGGAEGRRRKVLGLCVGCFSLSEAYSAMENKGEVGRAIVCISCWYLRPISFLQHLLHNLILDASTPPMVYRAPLSA